MRAVGARWVAEEGTVHDVHVEPRGQLIAGPLDDGSDVRVEIVDERDHVDYRLGR